MSEKAKRNLKGLAIIALVVLVIGLAVAVSPTVSAASTPTNINYPSTYTPPYYPPTYYPPYNEPQYPLTNPYSGPF